MGAALAGFGALAILSGGSALVLLAGAMSLAAGVTGTAIGGAQLGVSYSGNTTATQDDELTEATGDVMLLASSPGSAVGGAIGVGATGTPEGMRTGAAVGGLVEGGLSLADGILRGSRAAGSTAALRANGDPARELFGAGIDAHPELWNRQLARVSELGAEVVDRPGTLAYMPHSAPGRPGVIYLDPDASLSALSHEVQHLADDASFGFPGRSKLLGNSTMRWNMEKRAYQVELSLAQRMRGAPTTTGALATVQEIESLMQALRELRTEEWKRILAPYLIGR